LLIIQFYPRDTGPLAGDYESSFRFADNPDEVFVGKGHALLLPNDKMMLDKVGMEFYLDREIAARRQFGEV
jgi:hypothetical protein